MAAFNPGDAVAVLNETVRGKIISVGKLKSKIVDEDGFIREYPNAQIVLQHPQKYKLGEDVFEKEAQKKLASIASKSKVKPPVNAVGQPFEIDLHYESLTESTDIRANHEILQKQLTACRSFVQKSIAKKLKRIVIIHGKGEGVLKAEIHLYLNRLGSEHGIKLDFHDAPYSEYGMGGATEVIFY